jgi:soluble lytic murein transglycosylase-like protein
VVHITNLGKEKVSLEEREDEAPVQGFTPGPPPPEAAPPEPEPQAPAPAEASPQEAKPSSSRSGRLGARPLGRVQSPPEAWPLTAPVAADFPLTAAAEPPPAPAGVKTHRDQHGVLHITTAPAPAAPQPVRLAGRLARQAPRAPALNPAPVGQAELPAALPVRAVSLADAGPLAAWPVLPAALSRTPAGSAPAAPARVQRFRDKKGTIHIVGRGPSPVMAGSPTPALAPPAAWPEPGVARRRDPQGRLVIRNAPRGGAPPAEREERVLRLAPVVAEAGLRYGLPVALLEAVIKVESNFQPTAVSPKGAMGLMQLMPGTARFLGVADPFSPRENVLGGARYLRLLLDFFGQSLPLALAAYNAGFQRVIDAGCQVPNLKETQDFVAKVLGYYRLREKQRLALGVLSGL